MLNRRSFLGSSVSMLAAGCIRGGDVSDDAGDPGLVLASSAPDLVADVHCHTQNWSHVPLRTFITGVAHGHDCGRELSLAALDDTSSLDPELLSARARFLEATAVDPLLVARSDKEFAERAAVERAEAESMAAQVLFGRSLLGKDATMSLAAVLAEDASCERAGRPITQVSLGFLSRMFSPTSVLVDDLRQTFREVQLFTPAIVDMSASYGDTTKLNQKQQEDELRALMKTVNAFGAFHVHAFVAFDPISLALAPNPKLALEQKLFNIRSRVRDDGFVGVKIYPTAGFLPFDNRSTPGAMEPVSRTSGANVSAELVDVALAGLYDLCACFEIPLMAHCGPSNFVMGAQRYGHPENWLAVVNKGGWRDLHISLGHGGGPHGEAYCNDPLSDWLDGLGHFLGAANNGYFDLSYHEQALYPKCEYRSRYLDKLEQDVGLSLVSSRAMYGSDWGLLSNQTGKPERYYEEFRKLLPSSWSARDFFGGNAARCLGIAKGGATRDRLLAYYADLGVAAPPWLGPKQPTGTRPSSSNACAEGTLD